MMVGGEHREEFDGQVTQDLMLLEGGSWRDIWKGPGGELVVRSDVALNQMSGRHPHVFQEVFTDSVGNERVGSWLSEGANFQFLPDLFGPVLWQKREEKRLVWAKGG